MGESQSDATQLAAVLGAEKEIVILQSGDKPTSIEIVPLRLKQFSQVLKCVGELGDVVTDKGFDAMKFLGSGDVAIRLLSIATGLDIGVLETLELDEAALLAGAVWRVNRQFFFAKGETIAQSLGLSPEVVNRIKTVLSQTLPPTSSPAASPMSES